MAFRWQADDGPLLVLFGSSLPSQKIQNTKNTLPLAKHSGSTHELAFSKPWQDTYLVISLFTFMDMGYLGICNMPVY